MSSLPSPSVAALLSFIFPGAGQVYAGEARRGLLWAIPTIALVLVVLYLLAEGIDVIDLAASEQTLAAFLVLNLAFFFYHLAAMFDAYSLAQRERRMECVNMPPNAPLVLAALVVLTLLLHGIPQVVGLWGNEQINRLFTGRATDFIPTPSFPVGTNALPSSTARVGATPTSPGRTVMPTETGSPTPPTSTFAPSTVGPPTQAPPTPVPAAWAENGRLDILLVGGDAGPDRAGLRTDSMILLSVEVATGRAAFFGFPRNLINFPLPPEVARYYENGRFPQLLNALFRTAQHHPEIFPGEDEEIRGWRAITGAIQEMAGVPVDGVIGIDLNGFSMLVDELGGLWVDVPFPVSDFRYHPEDGSEPIEIVFKAGCHNFTGSEALAYSRTRHQDSDYRRMQRQQIVLLAMRRQYDPIELAGRVPELLDLAGSHLFTTFARDEIPELARLAERVDADRIEGIRFTPIVLARLGGIDKIDARVKGIFDEPAPEPGATPGPGEEGCPP